MAPIYVKGGVWTNVEDQILKAAVSKYGLNQWDRVASLLTKKNAKQAKARWNEWVSPNIDKSEWSRDEDEKLLRYARLMPNQWRSIASILGRTATNTVERYHVLLEDAADGELSVSGPGIETLPASGQEGDVNLNPESKAAKPDEEMDDDEREMLSEAKARLANTKGKKAKRKERERMLEESKRIAMLQKRRELKAAGIKVSLTSKNRKKRKEFDFNADIPHERDLPEGPFDISEEADRNTSDRVKFDRDVNKQGVSLKEVDDKIKRDKKKDAREKARSKRKIEPVDDETVTKRSRLELPKPVEDGREYGDDVRSLSSIFKEQPEVEDRDERINRAARDLIHRQALKSTLIDHEVKEEPKELQEEVKEETGRLSKKEVVSLLTAMLQRLPEPRSERIIPFLEPVNEEITEEPVRPRESLAILKGLSVPDPALLATLDLEGVDKQVYNELRALVKSDYKRHVDPTYNAEIIDGIDVDSYDRVMKEIKDIDSKEIPLEEEIDVLPQTFEVAEKIINVLHEFYSRAVQTEDKLAEAIEYDDYNEKRQQLIADIRQEAQEVAELDIEHKTLKLIRKEEEAAIEARSKRLNSMVNSVREALSVAEKRLQSRQV